MLLNKSGVGVKVEIQNLVPKNGRTDREWKESGRDLELLVCTLHQKELILTLPFSNNFLGKII